MDNNKIKILAFSDIHQYHNEITHLMQPANIAICAGDFTHVGSIAEFNSFLHWFSNLEQYKHHIIIMGNHEKGYEKNPSLYKSLIPDNILLLEDSSIKLYGLNFYGSSWSKEFCGWAFPYFNEQQAEEIWNRIPEDCDILITHQPPYSVRDYVSRIMKGEADHHVGCIQLLNRILELDIKCNIFGHLHDDANYGASKIGDTMFANVAQCNEAYQVKNRKPILFEVDLTTKQVEVIDYE